MTLDTIASRTFGLVQARDVRVVWRDGRLYIAKSPTDVITFECAAPVKSAGTYRVQIGEAALRFQVPSCGSCRRRIQQSEVGRMSTEDIIAAVSVG